MMTTDPILKAHAASLHRKAWVVDAHFDLAYDVANHRDRGRTRVVETDYLEAFRAGGFDLIVSSLFVHDFFLPEMALRKALDQVSYLLQEMDESYGVMRLCRTLSDVRQARTAGEIGVMLSFEGADPLMNDINLLRVFYELGVRGIGVAWSRRNHAADGSVVRNDVHKDRGGLTAFGVSLIEAAEKLGMWIDVSHLNDAGFWDVIDIAGKPVIASHANCRALVDTPRNLADDQIEALAETGGVIGINAISAYAGGEKSRVTVDDMIDHVDHVVRIAGIDHVGMGFDFCGGFRNFIQMPTLVDSYDVIGGHAALEDFTAGLVRRGYGDGEILKILGENFIRVFEATLS